MSKQIILILITLLLLFNKSFAQTDSLSGKYLSIGSKHAGICFGNSLKYSGLRFNFLDKYVKEVNIINFCLIKAKADRSNGLSLSTLVNLDNYNNGISFGVIGNSGSKRNGIAVSVLFNNISKLRGIGVAGLGLMGDTLNGFFVGGFAISKWKSETQINQINGVAISIIGTSAEKVTGLTVASINGSNSHSGLSIGLFNRTEKLRGVQLGLINYTGNNPKVLRWLPLINMHLGK